MNLLALVVLVAGCHSSGLVRGAAMARSETGGPSTLVLEPYPGGLRAKLHTRVPPASIKFSAQRTGDRVRIDMHVGRYREKCIREVDVILDLGPLSPGSYEVSIDDIVARTTVPDAGTAPHPDRSIARTAAVQGSCT